MSYERKFCGLSEYTRFQNIRPLTKSIDLSKWGRSENACAQPILNLLFWGCLRPIWPQMSHIFSFSFKYHISNAFEHLRLLRGHFTKDQILLQKYWIFDVDLYPQYSFEASEIILWANWKSLANATFILRTIISNLPIPW